MNKAFVREPDDTGQLNCPACGSLGIAVVRETWQSHVAAESAGSVAEASLDVNAIVPVYPVATLPSGLRTVTVTSELVPVVMGSVIPVTESVAAATASTVNWCVALPNVSPAVRVAVTVGVPV